MSFLHFSEPWWVYVSMPFISAAIGYLTKLIAIEMIFRPTEFVGIKPYLGWQGMVPRRAAKMAGIAVDSVMSKILQPEELFHKIRDEVCRDYATLLAKDILTPKAVMESLLTGPMSDKLFEMIQDEIKATIDDQTGIARPFVAMAIGGRKYRDMKCASPRR